MRNKIFGILTIIIGLVVLIFSINDIKKNNEKQKTYIETTATVVGYEECELDDNDIGQRFIAEYQIDRNKYQIVSNTCGTVTKGLNKKVSIKYNPNNPSDAIFANDKSVYIAAAVGVIFIICGFVVVLKKD